MIGGVGGLLAVSLICSRFQEDDSDDLKKWTEHDEYDRKRHDKDDCLI